MSDKKTAPAAFEARAQAVRGKDVKVVVAKKVSGVRLDRLPMKPNQPSHPVARFKGAKPAAGDLLEFTLSNDVTYVGEVSDSIKVDGEVIAEFKNGLTPVQTK